MKISLPAKIIILLLTALIAWNFFLPAAEDMYNNVTRSETNSSMDLKNVDFFVYYTAGSRLLHGNNPYFFGHDQQGNPIISDYHYPPVFLPIFSLFARLGYDLARLLWLVLYAISYLAILVIMARSMPSEWSFPFLVAGILLTLLAYPLLGHILTGQADIFIISLILGSYLAYATKHRILSAILLAVGTVLKVSPLFLLAYFVLFLRDYKYLLVYLASLLVIAAISLFFVPFSYYPDYIIRVLPEVAKGTELKLSQSLVSYFAFSPFLTRLISLSGLGALAVLAWLVGNFFSPAERTPVLPLASDHFRTEVVFILCLSWVLIFHTGVWPYTYVWLILPLVWLLTGLIRQRVKPTYLVIVILGIFLVMAKDYGLSGLNKLNLWGNMLLTITLIVGLFKKEFFSQLPGPH